MRNKKLKWNNEMSEYVTMGEICELLGDMSIEDRSQLIREKYLKKKWIHSVSCVCDALIRKIETGKLWKTAY